MNAGCAGHVRLGAPEEKSSHLVAEKIKDAPLVRERKIKK